MRLTPPKKVRTAIYVAVVMGTAVLVPLDQAEVLPHVVLAVWTSVAGAASMLAALNVSK